MTRGGKRTGAGRKPDPGTIKVISKAITLPPECWAWIDRQGGSRGKVVRGLIEIKIKQEENKMEIKIIETGEKCNLIITDPKSGCGWTNDLMGNHDALPEYDDDEGVYLMKQEDYNWWSDLIERYQEADDRFYQLCLDLDKPNDDSDYNAIREAASNISCDLDNYPESLQAVCDEFEKK